jgi:hypothetical protein
MLHRGRIARDREILEVRELGREDLEVLRPQRPPPTISRFRDSHHRVARLLAFGMSITQVAEATGYSMTRICVLKAVPAFQQLIADYRTTVVNDEFRKLCKDYNELVAEDQLKAERMIADRLDLADEEGEPLPLRDLLSISRRQDKGTNIQVNIGDFATQLDRAKRASAKIIEGSVQLTTQFSAAQTPPPVQLAGQTPRRKLS